jgi:predicted nucleic acid-binding protein
VNVVDSSAWLEYFSGGPNTRYFSAPIEDTEALIVPVLTLFEVFKVVSQRAGESAALQAITAMQQGRVIDLNASLAITAAKLSAELKLPLADSIILCTAQQHGATLWTQDADFKGMPHVKFKARRS